jgi:hypothetical protein
MSISLRKHYLIIVLAVTTLQFLRIPTIEFPKYIFPIESAPIVDAKRWIENYFVFKQSKGTCISSIRIETNNNNILLHVDGNEIKQNSKLAKDQRREQIINLYCPTPKQYINDIISSYGSVGIKIINKNEKEQYECF